MCSVANGRKCRRLNAFVIDIDMTATVAEKMHINVAGIARLVVKSAKMAALRPGLAAVTGSGQRQNQRSHTARHAQDLAGP